MYNGTGSLRLVLQLRLIVVAKGPLEISNACRQLIRIDCNAKQVLLVVFLLVKLMPLDEGHIASGLFFVDFARDSADTEFLG